jgi:outer membrane lipoprotein-sorting protein
MSSSNSKPLTDEQLDRHIAALRDETTAEGPSNEVIARTQAMIRDRLADERSESFLIGGRRPLMQRLVAMTLTQRIAALVAVTMGGLTLYVVFQVFSALSGTVAFADVARKFAAARTITYNSTVTLPGERSAVSRTFVAEPDRMRTEMSDGTISIRNGRGILVLIPAQKMATRVEISNLPGKPDDAARAADANLVDALRRLGEGKGEPLGEKTIDGVTTVGFRALVGNTLSMNVWADKKSALPVRVETTLALGGGQAEVVMDHFQMDPPLDEALFSMDVPQGYALRTEKFEMPAVKNVEETVIELLGEYAKYNNGMFPDSLQDWAAFAKLFAGSDQKTARRMVMLAGMVTGLTTGREHEYLGKGVKLGEKEKIVFWHRKDANSPYRAIYGDLRVEDVTADKLPTTRPTRPAR